MGRGLVTGAALPSIVPAAASTTITAGAGLTGGGDLSANRTIDAVANADGSIVVNANDIQVGVLATDAQHGARGGGTQHAVRTASAAGFWPASQLTADGNSGASKTIDFSTAYNHSLTLDSATCTLTFTAPPVGTEVTLVLTQDGTGGRVVIWPASVKDSPPNDQTLSSVTEYTFFYDGTSYWPRVSGVAPRVNGAAGSAITLNFALNRNQEITLSANTTLTFTAPPSASVLSLKITQDAGTARTVTWPTLKGSYGVSAVLGAITTLVMYYDGTNYFVIACENSTGEQTQNGYQLFSTKAAGGDIQVLLVDGSNQITIGDTSNYTAATLFLAASSSVRIAVNGFISLFNSTGIQLPTSGTFTIAPSSVSGAAPNAIAFNGGATSNTGGTGGSVSITGGAASAASGTHKGGPGIVRGGAATAGGTPLGGDVWLGVGTGASRDGNAYIGKTDPAAFNWQAMGNGIAEEERSAAPTGNPAGALYRYTGSGAGIARGTGGTVTTYAPA